MPDAEKLEICGTTVAPPGWWCSRTLGHEGPCAAIPDSDPSDDLIAFMQRIALAQVPGNGDQPLPSENNLVESTRMVFAERKALRAWIRLTGLDPDEVVKNYAE